MGLLASLRWNWRMWLIFVTPAALSYLLISSDSQVNKCAFMMGICTVYWVTESLPLPVTALLPVVMAPILGVLSTDEVCGIFFTDMMMLVTGAVFVAYAIEESNLHRRISLRLLLLIGVQPKRLLFSIVSITGFLSMWIANTVSTSLMAPIAQNLLAGQMSAQKSIQSPTSHTDDHTQHEIIDESSLEETKPLAAQHDGASGNDTTADNDNSNEWESKDREGFTTDEQMEDSDELKKMKKMKKMFNLAVCYSANIGGIGTLLGTPPNLVLAKTIADYAKDGVSPITYASWLKFGLPVCLFSLLAGYAWMSVSVFGFKNMLLCKRTSNKQEDKFMRDKIMSQYKSLGPMTYHEKVVLIHFIILLLLFVTRDPGIVPGWSSFFPPKHVKDSVSSVLICTSLFAWPKHPPRFLCSGSSQQDAPDSRSSHHETALDWKRAAKKFPWGVLFLLGGGVTLAQASKISGMSSVLVDYLSFVSELPPWVTILVLTSLTCLVTEVSSNTVVVIIILPILGDLAMKAQVNPLLYMLPVTAAASMAFMLPVATPPNAIIHAMGAATISDMVKTGFGMNILGIISINIVVNTVGYWAFSLDEMPSWIVSYDDVTGNATMGPINSTSLGVFDNIAMATNQSSLV